ncbi:MAG: DUF3887 domain-containing protein [Methanomicrobiales archaeon]|nr:DUF3887 domain-containing protein [Methanomicrobiales archaeon]
MDTRAPFLAALILLLAVSACGCMDRESAIAGEEAAQVLSYADPIAENLLTGLNEDNYTTYSRDFSPEMRQELDRASFEQSREFVTSRIGLYESKSDPVVTEAGDYVAVTYKAEFEQESGVDVRFVFKKDDASHQLQGLWFNSPKLRS